MKLRTLGLLVLALASTSAIVRPAFAQGTAFAYQGLLKDGTNPAFGHYDLTFALFNASSGGAQIGPTLTDLNVALSNGLFSVELDFGPSVFTGQDHWLELSVRTNGGAAFATLTPRQPILPVPYAITASNLSGTISASQITGTLPAGPLSGNYGNPLTLNNAANSFSGNGAGLVNVNAATVGGLAAASFWKTNGNSGTSPANGNFVGTSDNQPLELRVNGARALRLEPNGSGTPNLIGGYSNNVVNAGVTGATIAGGGGNGQTNGVTATGGTVGGGANNSAGNYGTVPGGFGNTASGQFSLAAGLLAQATNLGTFVWADAQLQNFTSTANGQFLIRASGGVGIGTNRPAAVLHVSSGTGFSDPQLRLDQTTQGDFSRLRFLSSTNAYWDVAVGGGAANVMNWFVSGIGNLMTLQPGGNLGILGTVSAGSFAGNGLVGWQVPAGTSIQTQPNSGYLLTNASQVTVTLPTSPAISDIVRVSGGGAGGWRLAQNASQSVMGNFLKSGGAISTNWVEGGTNKNISLLGVASSADGSKLIIAGYPGLYTSTNSGLTWKSNNAPVQSWGVVASSADGTKLVATTGNGVQAPIYTSTDSGATWTPRTVSRFWSSIASSTNGIKLVATDDLGTGSGGQIYTSTNSGVTWTPHGVNTNWAAVASSADGNKLVAVVAGGGIWVSSDSGVTWTETSSVATDWFAVCCSADGTIILAAAAGVYDGYLAYSHDSGGTWFNPKPLQLATWYAVACSADGTKQAAVEYGSGIWTSSDAGLTWTQTGQNAGGHRWTGVASSADGTKLIAVENDTHTVWLSQPATQTITSTGPAGYLTGGHGAAAELQYIGNNQFMQISHQGTVLAY